ncbi:hypothetical protein [Pectobacterium phage CX5]|uniref:Uncharacterized protein n=1 Tax=Pectobacterium phage CX5 TaxID=2652426 RepID=A0A5P8D5C9_9CAUD|nr:hypothetical protein [Pectobacterium phage CX5]QFP93657.1 hypothetical protein [Pectobacterium phage CX5-1]
MLQFINKLFLKAHNRAIRELDNKAQSLYEEQQHTLQVIDDLRTQLDIAEGHALSLALRRQAALDASDAYADKVRKLTAILY